MRSSLFLIFTVSLFSSFAYAQEWQPEFFIGASQYNGDLTQQRIEFKDWKPALNFNLKYNSGDFLNFRIGLMYTKLGANDKYNKAADLKNRNLNFRSDVLELNVIGELNLFDPDTYNSYPYIFAGVGVFHFNPYTFDSSNKKTYLQPLSTEGEGLSQFPDRKKYSLFQLCLPVGVGFRMPLNEKWDINYEFGYRILFTDYLDDVSKDYVNLSVLQNAKGQEAASLSYRGPTPFLYENQARGNPAIKDSYFIVGVKFTRKRAE